MSNIEWRRYLIRPFTIRSAFIALALVTAYCFLLATFRGGGEEQIADYHKPWMLVPDFLLTDNGSRNSTTTIASNIAVVTSGDSPAIGLVTSATMASKFEIGSTTNSSTTVVSTVIELDAARLELLLNTTLDEASLLELCPLVPPFFVGQLNMRVINNPIREHEIMQANPDLMLGGHWKPPNCTARHKVALIIPYRDRKAHLDRLLNFLFPILKKQQIDFRVIVAEQYGDGLFNKGRVMNAGFRLAEKFNVDCVIFHDVDMFPENDRNPYTCPEQPRHLGVYVNVLKYDLWYEYLLGGVVVIRMEHYRRVNGHSNMFWGYGGEDDDFGRRVLANNLTIERPPKPLAKYSMIRHHKRKYAVAENIKVLLNDTESRWATDGLNETQQWSFVSLVPKPLYYHLHVNVGEPPDSWRKSHRGRR